MLILRQIFQPVEFAKTQGHRRDPRWSKFVKGIIAERGRCCICGATSRLIGHHFVPFHVAPELELDPTNIRVMCEGRGQRGCHFTWGHLHNWRWWNPNLDRMVSLIESAKIEVAEVLNRMLPDVDRIERLY